VALGAAGVRVVVAENYARIFFRNSVSTGEIYPCESVGRLVDRLLTGQVVTVDLDTATLTVAASGERFPLKPMGDAKPVIDAGGIFQYARLSGMITQQQLQLQQAD
jgi:3-isopropylmalate/(R)-2-methylmalate dehydratase small subunit